MCATISPSMTLRLGGPYGVGKENGPAWHPPSGPTRHSQHQPPVVANGAAGGQGAARSDAGHHHWSGGAASYANGGRSGSGGAARMATEQPPPDRSGSGGQYGHRNSGSPVPRLQSGNDDPAWQRWAPSTSGGRRGSGSFERGSAAAGQDYHQGGGAVGGGYDASVFGGGTPRSRAQSGPSSWGREPSHAAGASYPRWGAASGGGGGDRSLSHGAAHAVVTPSTPSPGHPDMVVQSIMAQIVQLQEQVAALTQEVACIRAERGGGGQGLGARGDGYQGQGGGGGAAGVARSMSPAASSSGSGNGMMAGIPHSLIDPNLRWCDVCGCSYQIKVAWSHFEGKRHKQHEQRQKDEIAQMERLHQRKEQLQRYS